MEETSFSVLNTPIKKIRNLTLHSPQSTSPIRYPDLNDFPVKRDKIGASMAEKGYSQTLSNAVLRELDTRAQQISSNVAIPNITSRAKPSSRKRYSGAHKPLFIKMESISSHYAASRQEITSSATKKRRTLNGPEEIFLASQNDPSPTRRKVHLSSSPIKNDEAFGNVMKQNARDLSNDLHARRLQPLKLNVPLTMSSPVKHNPEPAPTTSPSVSSSPFKASRISPSKGSMNLHSILQDESHFAKPEGPVRIRQSSLQMAGVAESAIPTLSRKSSSNNLQDGDVRSKTGKINSGEVSDRSISHRPLRNKTSTTSLSQKPSLNNLQKKTSIPNLQKKPSIPVFTKTRADADTRPFLSKPDVPASHSAKQFSSSQRGAVCDNQMDHDSRSNASSRLQSTSSRSFLGINETSGADASYISQSAFTKPNVTIPKPFSLYNKPTISSSQKAFGSQTSLHSSMSDVSQSASQRSLNRFQKFKSRFA